MSELTLNNELHVLLTAMINSAKILYKGHAQYFKIAFLFVIAYVAFKLGRATVTDPLDVEVKSINNALINRQHYTIYLPKKMKSLAKTRKYLFIATLVISIVIGILVQMKHQLLMKRTLQEKQIGGIVFVILVVIVVGMWVYQKFLGFMVKRGGFNDHLLHEKLNKIITSFGKKT